MKNPLVVAGHELLRFKVVYNSYQSIVGGVRYREHYVQRKIIYSNNILDLGCGTGVVAKKMDSRQSYTGIDNSYRYVSAARLLKTTCKTFDVIQGDVSVENWSNSIRNQQFDAALALGLLHHLDDASVCNLLEGLRPFISSGGRLYTVDPVITEASNKIAIWFAKNDRGKYLRVPLELEKLFKKCGYTPKIELKQKQFRIPLDTVEITAASSS